MKLTKLNNERGNGQLYLIIAIAIVIFAVAVVLGEATKKWNAQEALLKQERQKQYNANLPKAQEYQDTNPYPEGYPNLWVTLLPNTSSSFTDCIILYEGRDTFALHTVKTQYKGGNWNTDRMLTDNYNAICGGTAKVYTRWSGEQYVLQVWVR